MANYYIQGSGGWPFGLDILSPSGQLFPTRADPNSNVFVGYFGFPTNPIEQGYSFRFWEGLDTTSNIWYGDSNLDGIADLRANFLIPFGVSPNSQVTAKITFNKNTKAYTRAGTPSTASVNFVSNNNSIMGSTPAPQNNASINVYYNGWVWEKDFTFNTTSTINFKIVLGSGNYYGDNNSDGLATFGDNFIPFNVTGGNTYRFRAKVFTTDLSISPPSFEYEVVCLTCPNLKQNQVILTPFNIYNKIKTDPPFSLQASANSNLPLTYSSSSPLFTINDQGVVTLLGLTGLGNVFINQEGNHQWNPALKEVFIDVEEVVGSCVNQCLDTGSLYFTNDTYINLYDVTGSGLFLNNDSNKNIGATVLSNESWQDYYTGFTGYGLSGFNNTNAGIILNINDTTKNNNQNKFSINYGVNESKNVVGNYHKQLIRIRPQKPKNVGYVGYVSNDNAWATYDVSTGMTTGSLTPNNIFSYAVDIVASGVISGTIYTGNVDITTATGQAYVYNSEKNPIIYEENLNSINTLVFNNIQDFCKAIEPCKPANDPQPFEFCYSGDLSNTTAFQTFLSGVLKKASVTEIIRPPINKNLLILNSTGETVQYSNLIYSGYILYNNWSSGDYIKWDLYNFNYIDLYQGLHLGNYPPYPNTGFKLYYPNDFDSLDSLVNKLNEKIDLFKNYPVWLPYDCLKDTESGIYITGKLIEFSKNIGTTGDLPIDHFNNRIDFISLRFSPQLGSSQLGKNETLSSKISIFSPQKPRKSTFKGFNYLIPINIQLEGFNKNTQNWDILDINGQGSQTNSIQLSPLSNHQINNLSGEFINMKRIVKSMGSVPPPQTLKEEEEEALPESEEEGEENKICKEIIIEEEQRVIAFNENPLCPPELKFKEIKITAPLEECKKYSFDKEGRLIQSPTNAFLCGEAGGAGGAGGGGGGGEPSGPEKKSVGDYYIIRTGWNFVINNLNNNISSQNIDINTIYDKYKISLYDFISIPTPILIPKNSFFIKQVNLYTLDKSGFEPHKGPELCSIGADYTIDVSGLFPIPISGIWNYNLLPEESGIYRFFKTPFVRKIEENEKIIKFNKVSGKVISPSGTGYLSTSGYGIGTVYYEDNNYYFYNPSSQLVYFTETLTGEATGFRRLSGQKTIIKQKVINKELLLGGRLNNSNFEYHELVSDGTFISNIEDVQYVQYDVLGLYPITGQVTGDTISGKLNINNIITMTGIANNNRYAYYPIPTGFTFSKILFNINYNTINNFNYLSLNDNTIIYHQDSINYPAPSYFNSNETLLSIINGSSNIFSCTGVITGSNIELYSTLKGESGNINLVSNSTGLQVIQYISGINIYPRLYKIKTIRNRNCIIDDPDFIDLAGNCEFSFERDVKDPIITGNLQDFIFATGFYYSNSGSGYITGDIDTFTGVRTFFDVWNIETGNLRNIFLNFKNNNFISGNSYYSNSLIGTGPTNINLKVFYSNLFNIPANDIDSADLIVKDLNNINPSNSGILFRLRGVK